MKQIGNSTNAIAVPKLVQLKEQGKKFITSTVEEKTNLVKYLVAFTGSGKDNTKEEFIVLMQFLETALRKWTIEEVKHAYTLASTNNLQGIDIYPTVTPLSIGKIMKAYEDLYIQNSEVKKYKRQLSLQKYEQSQIKTTEQIEEIMKKGVQASYEDFLSGDYKLERLHPSYKYLYLAQKVSFKRETISFVQDTAKKIKDSRERLNKSRKKMGDFLFPELDVKFLEKALGCEAIFERAKSEGIKNIITEEIINTEI